MSELKPCPFCGGNAIYVTGSYIGGGIVKCKDCHAQTFIVLFDCLPAEEFDELLDKKAFLKEKTIEKWNTRHYPQEVKQAVERMKPKKVIPEKVYFAPKNRGAYFIRFLCPTCWGIANRATNREFCNNNGCGQALDWEETK